jgi:TetR/AcrR family transcriptional regulator
MNGAGQRPGGRVRRGREALILGAAEACFAEHGFRGTSMSMIALRAGLSKASLHYYFGSKRTLYATVLERILTLWDDGLDALRAEDDPAEALTGYIRAKLEFSWRYPLSSRVFAMEVIGGATHLEAHFDPSFRNWLQGRTEVFRAWSAAGRMDPVDPLHLIFLIWSSTQHYADFAAQIGCILGHSSRAGLALEEVCASLTGMLLKGCGVTREDFEKGESSTRNFSSLRCTGAGLETG